MSLMEQLKTTPKAAPTDYAELILEELNNYVFPNEIRALYAPEIWAEIEASVKAFKDASGRYNTKRLRRILINDNPILGERDATIRADQEIWAKVRKANPDVDWVVNRIRDMKPGRGRVSALLALRKLIDREPDKVERALNSLATDTQLADTDLTEWARISLQEIALQRGGNSAEVLANSASDRPVHYTPGQVFDVTMPLYFECRAITKIGQVEIETQISPLWFTEIFGDAMAMVNAATFQNELVLEKQVEGLHPDGSMHYEHFPFAGETSEISPSVHRHNYWASVRRPFYASGKVEDVSNNQPVYAGMPMTFFRLAHTFTHERYAVAGQPMPESVRGIFFGFGHTDPLNLIKKAGNLGVGDFQISPRINPHTNEEANTIFFGTFFGKLQGLKETGEIALNARSVHCDAKGRLDYNGDGSMAPDPIRPDDWAQGGSGS
ncbi:hypothetical protein FIV00_17110 [Labrenzia sp. THAF82]|uniref:hypothetical protein n=1 Tax=Labrenzia sp. THAF82 TaxID=2587861 RepID=UPI001267F69D|nr:hypothetical protein [Labrenzia sp. THAF82]QFT32213.1 hypothetical protein FIV00_17110 [Labrenzia sp. THAF82]